MTLIPKSQSAPYPPQGGYSFTDPRTGMRFDGLQSNAEATALKIIAHRSANKNLYPEGGGDLASVIQEVYRQKFTTHPHLFLGYDVPAAPAPIQKVAARVVAQLAAPRQLTKLCRFCSSAEFDEILCPTCAGKRVTGWKCRKCGKKQ